MSAKIGPYEIVGELGRGGMGIVYKAREESLQRFVAIKMLGHQLTENDSVVQRFMREARAVADVNHPNLVHVFRVDKHEGQPYFAMEYVEGESLKSLIERERQMQPPRALKILGEVAAGLGAAHEKGVVHRDIKPENIMLTRFGGVKVVDFGIARIEEPGTRLTTTGVGLGTPSYLSPEVCLSQDVDARSDIFSLGVVLFEMLTGEIPFKSDSPFELMTKVVEARVPDIKALNPNVDDGVRQILAKMIAKRPKLRYQSCNELIGDIEDYRAGRVPRWSRDMRLETEPSGPSGEDVAPAAEAERPAVTGTVGNPAAGPDTGGAASGGTARTEAVGAAASDRPPRRSGAALAVAFALVMVAGGAGAAWMLFADGSGPLASWFDGGDGEGVASAEASPAGDQDSDPGPVASVQPVEPVEPGTDESVQPGLAPVDSGVDAPGASEPVRSGAEVGYADVEPATAPASRLSAAGVDPPDGLESPAEAEPSLELDTAIGSIAASGVGDGEVLGEHSGPPGDTVSSESAEPGAAPFSAGGMPDDPRVAVVAVGDPAVAGPIGRDLRRSLARASFEVFDEQLLDGLVYAESLAGVARSARSGGVDVLVYVDVVPTGNRELRFYGRRESQQLATLEVRVVDLHQRRNLGRPLVRDLEYVGLTADRKAREVAGPVARDVLSRLRALRD